MASSDDYSAAAGTNAVADQLTSLSVDEAAGTKPTTTDADAPAGGNNETVANKVEIERFCSACGKGGTTSTLNKCGGCRCVFYCSRSCQMTHRKVHKRECKAIKEILKKRSESGEIINEPPRLEPIGDLPPMEECPICMHVMPINESLRTIMMCCGKKVCGGCFFVGQKINRGRNVEIACPFCREKQLSKIELQGRLIKRAEEEEDALAIHALSLRYAKGQGGLPVDSKRALELCFRSHELGYREASHTLGTNYLFGHMGCVQDEEKAMSYFRLAAEKLSIDAMYNLGVYEHMHDNYDLATQFWRKAAAYGHLASIDNLITNIFAENNICHADLANSMQAKDKMRIEMKSEGRDLYIDYLKSKGRFQEEERFIP